MTDLTTPVAALPSLQRKLEGRALRSLVLTTLAWFAALVASVPLISVLYMLITRGGARLNLEVFTELPPTGFEMGGGFGNAMAGTFVMVGIAAAIAVPVGILAAVFLAELGPDSKLANAARFAAKMLTGLPSILAGVFAYALVVMTTGTYSAPAGGVALAVLMLPIVFVLAWVAFVPMLLIVAAPTKLVTPMLLVALFRLVVFSILPSVTLPVLVPVLMLVELLTLALMLVVPAIALVLPKTPILVDAAVVVAMLVVLPLVVLMLVTPEMLFAVVAVR